MKDYYDVWALAGQFEFAGQVLQGAIKATCLEGENRYTTNTRLLAPVS